MDRSLSTELALRAFEADAALSAALAEFQAGARKKSIATDACRAAGYGFAWFARPSEAGHFQVVLRHKGGAEISADGESIVATLAGLLGHPWAHDVAVVGAQASESEQEAAALEHAGLSYQCDPAGDITPHAESEPIPPLSPAQVAAESLAAATGGAVVLGPSEYVPDNGDAEPDQSQPLTAEQKTVCVEMIKALTVDQRKAFTISFRDAFRVPREAKAIAPLITEVRHMEFCDCWSIEAAGGVAA